MGTAASTETAEDMSGKVDFDAVRKDLKDMMENPNWDDGTYAPLLIRLGWHSCGTYTTEDVPLKGGSNGATMRFPLEQNDPENAGLAHAIELLKPIQAKHKGLSHSDLWILAAYVSLEVTGGPVIEFHPGRTDKVASEAIPPGRLPGAEHGLGEGLDKEGRINGWENLAAHIRQVFTRMGFTDREMVALICGGHVYGRCHRELTGYEGAWVEEPFKFSNEYAADLIGDEWMFVKSDTTVNGEIVPDETRPGPGKRQYMTKWEPPEARDAGDAAAFPPGLYKIVAEEWINVRRSHSPDSDVIDQPKEGEDLMIVATRSTGYGIRGQLDIGGWVSIVSSSGEDKLLERTGNLDMKPAHYRLLHEGAERATLFDSAPASAEEAKNGAGILKEKIVEITSFVFLDVDNNQKLVFGQIKGGESDSKWVAVVPSEEGAIFERIVPGYNDTPRTSVGNGKFVKYQMMLPSDMVLVWDDSFRQYVEIFANDEELLKKEFGDAYKKLTELGVPGCPGFKP